MKLLVIGDGADMPKELQQRGVEAAYIDLRKGYQDVSVLMDLYETLHPELISEVREAVVAEKPDTIVVVGRMEGYGWLATIITRFFGQFSSWNGQRDTPFGKTTIKVDGRDVDVFAIASLEDWQFVETNA